MSKTTNWATANATATWLLETGRSGTCSNIIVPNRASNIQHPTFYCRKLLPLGVFALAGGNLGWVGGKVIAIVISQRSKSNCLHCLACLAKMHTVAQTFVGTRSQAAVNAFTYGCHEHCLAKSQVHAFVCMLSGSVSGCGPKWVTRYVPWPGTQDPLAISAIECPVTAAFSSWLRSSFFAGLLTLASYLVQDALKSMLQNWFL